MKSRYTAQNSIATAAVLVTLPAFALYAVGSHKLRIPLIMVITLTALSLIAVHVLLSLAMTSAIPTYTVPANGHVIEVKIPNMMTNNMMMKYDPNVLIIHVGEKVIFKNNDMVAHTATSGSGPLDPNSGKIFDTKIIMSGQSSAPQQLKGVKAGDVISYYCEVHPLAKGIIYVLK
jgi:plastocyanin